MSILQSLGMTVSSNYNLMTAKLNNLTFAPVLLTLLLVFPSSYWVSCKERSPVNSTRTSLCLFSDHFTVLMSYFKLTWITFFFFLINRLFRTPTV